MVDHGRDAGAPGEARAWAVFAPGAVSAETAAFNADLEAKLAALPSPMALPIPEIRRLRAEGMSIFPVFGPDPEMRSLEIEGPGGPVGLRLAEPAGARGTFLHIHGGGWTFNAPEQYDRLNLSLARDVGCRVISVRYRLAPEHPWPACAEDVVAAARWALGQGGGLVIGGESAGAHLAAVAMLRLRDDGALDGLRGAVLSYGMYDLAGTPSLRRWGERFLVLSTPIVDWFVGNLLGQHARRDPDVSPLWANLEGVAPVLLQCGTEDPLIDDTLFLASRLRAAGGDAALQILPGGVHAFDQFDLAIAREALSARARFVGERLAG